MLRLLILLASAAALVSVCHSQEPARLVRALQGSFEVLFVPGSRDDAGRFMGGMEMRVLTTHAGKLYAGNGYWEDQPGPEGLQGAEILVLDSPGARWRVDHFFDEQLPDGRRRDLAVSALDEVTAPPMPLQRTICVWGAPSWRLQCGSTSVAPRPRLLSRPAQDRFVSLCRLDLAGSA
jgi:hypothetical protein